MPDAMMHFYKSKLVGIHDRISVQDCTDGNAAGSSALIYMRYKLR